MTNSSNSNHKKETAIESDHDSPSLLAHRRSFGPLTVSVRASHNIFFKMETDPRIEESEDSEESQVRPAQPKR